MFIFIFIIIFIRVFCLFWMDENS